MRVLAASGTAVTAAAGTDEQTLATVIVPRDTLGPTGTMRITSLWTVTNGTNDKTVRVTFGGTEFREILVTEQDTINDSFLISNRDEASQVAPDKAGSTGAAITGTVETRLDTVLAFTAQKETSGETITLERYKVEVEYGA